MSLIIKLNRCGDIPPIYLLSLIHIPSICHHIQGIQRAFAWFVSCSSSAVKTHISPQTSCPGILAQPSAAVGDVVTEKVVSQCAVEKRTLSSCGIQSLGCCTAQQCWISKFTTLANIGLYLHMHCFCTRPMGQTGSVTRSSWEKPQILGTKYPIYFPWLKSFFSLKWILLSVAFGILHWFFKTFAISKFHLRLPQPIKTSLISLKS